MKHYVPMHFCSRFSLFIFIFYLGISHHEPCQAHLPVFLCSPLFPCDCLPPWKKQPPPPNKSILCGLYVHQIMVKFLVANPAREDESFSICICSRSHQLRRAIRRPEQTLILLQATVPITGLWMGLGIIRPQTSNTALGCITTTDPFIALSDCMDHEPQHGLRRLPHTIHLSMAPEAAKPEDISEAES